MKWFLFLLKRSFPLLLAGFWFVLGAFLLVSLFSYHPSDPSFNRASDGEILNLAGAPGAYVANPLLQLFGLSSYIFGVFFLCWSVRLVFFRQLSVFLLYLPFACIAVASFAVLVSFILPSQTWEFSEYGGFLGMMAKTHLLEHLPPLAVGSIAAAFLMIACVMGAGLPLASWHKVFTYSGRGVVYLYRKVRPYREVSEEEELEEENTPAVSPKKRRTRAKRKKKQPAEMPIPHEQHSGAKYILPDRALLQWSSDKSKKSHQNKAQIEKSSERLSLILEDFGIRGEIVKVRPGPVVTLYELEPAAGIKSSRVIGLADDIARSMSALSTRIAVIPGKNAIGIELPNTDRETVYLRELLEDASYTDTRCKLPLVLGKDIGGDPVIADLSKMPHLLVAGTTGSGKSVAINTMILSLLYSQTPEQCRFIMIDPKMLELSVYDDIPHLLTPVVTEPGKAVTALKWVVREMENRYRLMSQLGVRNISGYNARIQEAIDSGETLERVVQTGFEPETGKPIIEKVPMETTLLPFIVVIVDEMADLMLVAGKEIEASIQRLAQMARAAGIHLIMATQRPSVDVITGVIKANFPTRISFQVTSRIDSRTILGEQGGEQLLGMGDMLYMEGGGRLRRVHGPFVDDREVEKVVSFLKQRHAPSYIDDFMQAEEESSSDSSGGMMDAKQGEENSLYDQAVAIVQRDRKASTSYIQRCLRIGYNRAATIIERMEKEGVVSKANHVGKREVLVPESELV